MSLESIHALDLSSVCGGAGGQPQYKDYNDYVAQKRKQAEGALLGVACPLAGSKAGKQLAEGMYKNKTTDKMRIGAGDMVEKFCFANGLPADAKLPQ